MINNNLKVPYSDQFSIGMRNKLGDWNTSATVARIAQLRRLRRHAGQPLSERRVLDERRPAVGQRRAGLRLADHVQQRHRDAQTRSCCCRPRSRTRRNRAGARRSPTRTPMRTRTATSTSTIRSTRRPSRIIPSSLRTPRPSTAWSRPASIDGPWGMTYSAKLTLATPIPNNGFINYNYPVTAPNGANNLPVAGTPPGTEVPVRRRHLRLSHGGSAGRPRTGTCAGSTHIQLRGDMLNVFNYKNLVDVITTYPDLLPGQLQHERQHHRRAAHVQDDDARDLVQSRGRGSCKASGVTGGFGETSRPAVFIPCPNADGRKRMTANRASATS